MTRTSVEKVGAGGKGRVALGAVAGLLAAMGCVHAGEAQASQGPLAGDALRQAIAGRRVYLAVPLGGEFPLFYQRDGKVDGSGQAVGLGKYMKPSDSGRWWVEGERLCQKWTTWYDGKVFCFTVTPTGPGRIQWVRDDGLSGSARIAD